VYVWKDGDWFVPKHSMEELSNMTTAQILVESPFVPDSIPEYSGYYVHYVGSDGQLVASQNYETGQLIKIPENLQSLDSLPTRIHNVSEYPVVAKGEGNMEAFVAWMHYKYDDKAKNLKEFPFSAKGDTKIHEDFDILTFSTFFTSVQNINQYMARTGMVEILDDNGKPAYWGYPEIIVNNGVPRVRFTALPWDSDSENLSTVNGIFNRLTTNPSLADKWQTLMIGPNVTQSCGGYTRASGADYKGCMNYSRTYYLDVRDLTKDLITTGEYSYRLETTPTLTAEDAKSFHVGN